MRRLIATLVLVLPALATSAASPRVACAQEGGHHAALVVDSGSDVRRLCVALDAASVSGVHLIELAGRQHGLEYSLGFGAQAVCSLAGVGVQGGDCFAGYPEYWGYWHGDGSGGWSWASSGAGGARIGNGDIDGWVWGTGDSAATHDRPPRTLLDGVCQESEPASEPEPQPQAPPEQGSEEPQEIEVGSSPSQRATRKDRDRREPSASSSPPGQERERGIRAAASIPDPGSGGPPAALYLALVAAAVLAGGGWLRLRARGPAP